MGYKPKNYHLICKVNIPAVISKVPYRSRFSRCAGPPVPLTDSGGQHASHVRDRAQACINSYIKHRPSHTALMLFEARSLLDHILHFFLSHDSLLQWFSHHLGLPSSVTQTESSVKQCQTSLGTKENGKAELK